MTSLESLIPSCTMYLKEGDLLMKIILRVLALPILFIVRSVCILGNLLTNMFSYVIGMLLLVIAGCTIYCITQAMWVPLVILISIGLAAILAVFLCVLVVVKAETIGISLGKFIRS